MPDNTRRINFSVPRYREPAFNRALDSIKGHAMYSQGRTPVSAILIDAVKCYAAYLDDQLESQKLVAQLQDDGHVCECGRLIEGWTLGYHFCNKCLDAERLDDFPRKEDLP